MQISKRLKTVASFVREGSRIADIGTDHAYVPILLAEENRISSALAMDVKDGPLLRARGHIEAAGFTDRISTRISDGLAAYTRGEADTLVIAGMGGALLIRILEEGKDKLLGMEELVLSPQSEIGEVRRYLQENKFQIIKETMLMEDGKFYTVMKAVPGRMEYQSAVEFEYGKLLLEERHPVLYDYLIRERRLCDKIFEELTYALSEAVEVRKIELERKRQEIQEALGYYEMQQYN